MLLLPLVLRPRGSIRIIEMGLGLRTNTIIIIIIIIETIITATGTKAVITGTGTETGTETGTGTGRGIIVAEAEVVVGGITTTIIIGTHRGIRRTGIGMGEAEEIGGTGTGGIGIILV